MHTTLRVLAFGIVSGLIWSGIAGTLNELFRSPREAAVAIVAGVLAGVATSFALKLPLARFGKSSAIAFGALSLPVAAFTFGVLLSLLQWAALGRDLAPFTLGFQYAVLSTISVFAIILFPLAVITTLLLRRVIIAASRIDAGKPA